MKKLSRGIAVAAALGFIAGPVSAADMPVKAPPPVMPALYNWSGVYIGVEAGAIMGQRTDWEFLNVGPILGTTGSPLGSGTLCGTPFGSPGSCANVGHPLHGGFVGGEAGFNWQVGRWVFGIEGDGNWAELEEALTCAPPFVNFTCGSKISDFETVRVRIGYAFGPRGDFLAYVTGGWATARIDAFEADLSPVTLTSGGSFFPRADDWQRHNGFTVGGGFEYGITSWLSLKGEALYVWLAGRSHCFPSVPLAPGTLNGGCTNQTLAQFMTGPTSSFEMSVNPAHVQEDFVLFRMGLNARLWWGKAPAPVVASY